MLLSVMAEALTDHKWRHSTKSIRPQGNRDLSFCNLFLKVRFRKLTLNFVIQTLECHRIWQPCALGINSKFLNMAYKQWDPAQLSLNTPNLPVVSHHYLQIVFSLTLESVPIGALHGQVSAALSTSPPTHTHSKLQKYWASFNSWHNAHALPGL